MLRAGGSFLVEDILGHEDEEAAAFILEVERRRDPSHVRAYRQIEWTAFLRAAGLTVHRRGGDEQGAAVGRVDERGPG